MSKIEYDGSGELHITNITEARTTPKEQFDRVITTCQDSIEDNIPDDITYSFHRMSDGPHNSYGGYHSYYMFEQASDELYDALSSGETVLIHCHAGQSRSVAVATAAIGKMLDLSRTDALELVHRYRPTYHYPDMLLMDHASEFLS